MPASEREAMSQDELSQLAGTKTAGQRALAKLRTTGKVKRVGEDLEGPSFSLLSP